MRQLFRAGMISALLLLLIACGSAPASNTGSAPGAASPAPAATTSGDSQTQGSPAAGATETPLALAEGVFPIAVMTRSGGMQGKTETMVVLSNGLLRLIDGGIDGQPFKEARARADQINKLDAAVQTEGWQQLKPTYGEQVPDGYSYKIVANFNDITTYDGAQKPPLLEDVLGQLNELWQQALQS
jgi:hypothetical protein